MPFFRVFPYLIVAVFAVVCSASGCKEAKDNSKVDFAAEVTKYEKAKLGEYATVVDASLSGFVSASTGLISTVLVTVEWKVNQEGPVPEGSCLAFSNQVSPGKNVKLTCDYEVQGAGSGFKDQETGQPKAQDSGTFKILGVRSGEK